MHAPWLFSSLVQFPGNKSYHFLFFQFLLKWTPRYFLKSHMESCMSCSVPAASLSERLFSAHVSTCLKQRASSHCISRKGKENNNRVGVLGTRNKFYLALIFSIQISSIFFVIDSDTVYQYWLQKDILLGSYFINFIEKTSNN